MNYNVHVPNYYRNLFENDNNKIISIDIHDDGSIYKIDKKLLIDIPTVVNNTNDIYD